MWRQELAPFLNQNYNGIITTIKNSSAQYGNLPILPKREQIFNAFQKNPNQLWVVLLGMDPYPMIGAANGLSFSYIQDGKKTFIPASLKNIFKEIKTSVYNDGELDDEFWETDLTKWSRQGVFLLNTALTVLAGQSGAHLELWRNFTKEVFRVLNKQHPLVFILLGNEAKNYAPFIDPKHFILKAGHPSPLNRKRDFLGSNVFVDTNKILKEQYNVQIKW